MKIKKNKSKNNPDSQRRRDEIKLVSCPSCGKESKPKKHNFCPSCGWELFSPNIEKKWSIKVFFGITLAVAVLFIIYFLLKDPIYYWLDKVPYG